MPSSCRIRSSSWLSTVIARFRFSSGYACSSRFQSVVSSACALARDTPDFSRPFTTKAGAPLVVEGVLARSRKTLRHHAGDVKRGTKGRLDAGKACRRDADHMKVDLVDPDDAVDDRPVARQGVVPEVVAEHDDRIPPRCLAFLTCECPAQRGLYDEDVEEVVADQHPHPRLANGVSRSREAEARELVGDQPVERARQGPQIAVVGKEMPPRSSLGVAPLSVTTAPASRTGSGRRSRASARLKTAPFAPMPSAIDRAAIIVKSGSRRRSRSPYRTSCGTVSIQAPERASLTCALIESR